MALLQLSKHSRPSPVRVRAELDFETVYGKQDDTHNLDSNFDGITNSCTVLTSHPASPSLSFPAHVQVSALGG